MCSNDLNIVNVLALGIKGDGESKGTGVIYNKIGETTPVPFDSSRPL